MKSKLMRIAQIDSKFLKELTNYIEKYPDEIFSNVVLKGKLEDGMFEDLDLKEYDAFYDNLEDVFYDNFDDDEINDDLINEYLKKLKPIKVKLKVFIDALYYDEGRNPIHEARFIIKKMIKNNNKAVIDLELYDDAITAMI